MLMRKMTSTDCVKNKKWHTGSYVSVALRFLPYFVFKFCDLLLKRLTAT